jgi:endoglucanase
VEAENYTSMSGVQTEVTYDAGGGKNVGWIDNGDWMDYSVNVPSAGSYTLNLRVATPNTGAQVQVKNAGGALLSTVTLPNTGAYQTWQTTSTTVTLQAGTQTIRLQSSASLGWNINWWEMVGSGAALSLQSPTPATATTVAPTMTLFPNPVSDKFVLQVDNNLSGALDVQILSLQGAVLKQFSLTKAYATSSQYYVSIGDLPTGTYVVKATMSGWTESQQVSKL